MDAETAGAAVPRAWTVAGDGCGCYCRPVGAMGTGGDTATGGAGGGGNAGGGLAEGAIGFGASTGMVVPTGARWAGAAAAPASGSSCRTHSSPTLTLMPRRPRKPTCAPRLAHHREGAGTTVPAATATDGGGDSTSS